MVAQLPVEGIAEREFREVVALALKLGGPAAIGALKAALSKS